VPEEKLDQTVHVKQNDHFYQSNFISDSNLLFTSKSSLLLVKDSENVGGVVCCGCLKKKLDLLGSREI